MAEEDAPVPEGGWGSRTPITVEGHAALAAVEAKRSKRIGSAVEDRGNDSAMSRTRGDELGGVRLPFARQMQVAHGRLQASVAE